MHISRDLAIHPPSTMIHAVLIFNTNGQSSSSLRPNHSRLGKPRLSKFYNPIPPLTQQVLIAQIFSLISDRPSGVCNFLDAPDLHFPTSGDVKGKSRMGGEDEARVIYRHYATLYFVWVLLRPLPSTIH